MTKHTMDDYIAAVGRMRVPENVRRALIRQLRAGDPRARFSVAAFMRRDVGGEK